MLDIPRRIAMTTGIAAPLLGLYLLSWQLILLFGAVCVVAIWIL